MRKILTFLSLFLLFLSILSSSSSNVIWSEDFSTNLDGWLLNSYNRAPPSFSAGHLTTQIKSGFSIIDGVLNSGYDYVDSSGDSGNVSYALHPSTMNYGNWSFDTFLDNWTTTTQHFEIDFLFYQDSNNYNFSSKTFTQIYSSAGFSLLFSGKFYYDGSKIDLYRNNQILDSYNPIPSMYNSFHHFLVSRSLNGTINVYMDNKLIMNIYDGSNTFKIENSQMFTIVNYYGICKIDNITEMSLETSSETVNTNSTPGWEIPILFLALETIFLTRKLSNRWNLKK